MWLCWFRHWRVGLVDALTAHYEKATRSAGEDRSILALETLAIKAFGDMGQTARLRLIRDRFIAGHNSCALRRHLDSVPPETPIRDIVDRCRVWESHANSDIRQVRKPGPEPVFPTYVVSGPDRGVDDLRVAAVTTPQYMPGIRWRILFVGCWRVLLHRLRHRNQSPLW